MFFSKKYLTKEQKLKRNFIFGLILGLSLVIITASIYQFIIIKSVKEKTRQEVLDGIDKNKSKQVKVVVLNKDIAKGTPIDIDNDLEVLFRDSEVVPSDIITDKNKVKNMVPKINLSKNASLSSSMVADMNLYITDDLKYQDFSHIVLNKFLKKDDYIDIRYKKKDGSDFVVASKLKVQDLNGQVFASNITEEQRVYINNSTVAANLTGGSLYTTIYPDPENQEPAKITYELNNDIKKMIEKNPNIVKEAEKQIKDRNENKNKVENNEVTSNEEDKKPQFIEGGKNE